MEDIMKTFVMYDLAKGLAGVVFVFLLLFLEWLLRRR
jgi:hypothetical protein